MKRASSDFSPVAVAIFTTAGIMITDNIIETVITQGDMPEGSMAFGASRSTIFEFKMPYDSTFWALSEVIVRVYEKGTDNIIFEQWCKIKEINTALNTMTVLAYGVLAACFDATFDISDFYDTYVANTSASQRTFGMLITYIVAKTGVDILTANYNWGVMMHSTVMPLPSDWEHWGNYTYRQMLEFIAGRFFCNVFDCQVTNGTQKVVMLQSAGHGYPDTTSDDEDITLDVAAYTWKDSYKNKGLFAGPSKLVCKTTTIDAYNGVCQVQEERELTVGAGDNAVEFENILIDTASLEMLQTWEGEFSRNLVDIKLSGAFMPEMTDILRYYDGAVSKVFALCNVRSTIKGGIVHEISSPEPDNSVQIVASSGGVQASVIVQLTQAVNTTYKDYAEFKSLTSDNIDTINLTVSGKLSATEAVLQYATITNLDVAVGRIGTLETDNQTINDTLTVHGTAIINKAEISDLNVTTAKIDDLTSIAVTTDNLSAKVATLGYLKADTAQLTYATINTLQSDYATITSLNSATARIGVLESNQITTTYLDTHYADIDLANIEKADIGTMLANIGLISSATITDGHVTGCLDSVTIDAGKITAGTLDASNVTIINLDCANLTVGTINGTQIADAAIDLSKLSTTCVSGLNSANNKVYYQASAPTEGMKTGDTWFDTDGGNKIYSYDGTNWTARALDTEAFAAGSITASLIEAGAITTAKLAAGAVTADTIAACAITADKITASAITADKINAGAITADKIIAGAITATKIYAGAITADKIATNAVTASKINAGAITVDKISAGAVTAEKLSVTDLSAIGATIAGFTISNNSITGTNSIIRTNSSVDVLEFTKITGGELYSQGYQGTYGYGSGSDYLKVRIANGALWAQHVNAATQNRTVITADHMEMVDADNAVFMRVNNVDKTFLLNTTAQISGDIRLGGNLRDSAGNIIQTTGSLTGLELVTTIADNPVNKAVALTTDAGSATRPVYFSNGKPVMCNNYLYKTVPSDAVFTDTNTWRGIVDSLTSYSAVDSLTANQGRVLKGLVDGKSAIGHPHVKSDITDFPSSMPASDVYSWAKASTKPSYAWSEITSKPTTFAPSSHTHDYITSNGRLTCATTSNRAAGLRLYEIYTNGYPFTYGNILQFNGANGVSQLAAQWHGTELYYRSSPDTNTIYSDWVRLLNSSNYTGFVPTKTGSGASGTWGINITGNAATADIASSAGLASACSGNSATATKATQDGNGNVITSTYALKTHSHTDYAAINHAHMSSAISDRIIKTAVGNLGYSAADINDQVITASAIACWNGAYTGTTSNLAYCNKGAFGDMATKTASNYSLTTHTHSTYALKTVTDNYCNDTGWVEFDASFYNTNLTYYSAYQKPKYRKIGKLVQISGCLKVTATIAASNAYHALRLPSTLAWDNNTGIQCVVQGYGQNRATIQGNYTGSVYWLDIGRYGVATSIDMTSGHWFRLDITYYTAA